mmetsp:Transcript_36090/g.82681  ORF Transcript_36090/g.82681 Transcript_36090/m.82681 type:complete len:138 (-) Transcript_36090:132-545(-)
MGVTTRRRRRWVAGQLHFEQRPCHRGRGCRPHQRAKSGNDSQKEWAAKALYSLAVNNNGIQIAIARGRQHPAACVARNNSQKEEAACVMWRFAVNNRNQIAIARVRGIPPLVTRMWSGEGGGGGRWVTAIDGYRALT